MKATSTCLGSVWLPKNLLVGSYVGTMSPREISKAELEVVLLENPNARLVDLKKHFKCGSSTIRRELARHDLKTKPLSEREKPWLEGDRNPLRQWKKAHPEWIDNQRGEGNPIHKVKHLYEDPEYVRTITRGIRSHVAKKTGKSYEDTYGVEKAEQYKEKLRAASPERLRKTFRRETQIERTVSDWLCEWGVAFQREVQFGYFTVDFFVPSHQLIIQTDGDYWHGNPEVFSADKLTKHQRRRRSLDQVCDTYVEGLGLTVVRLWELDINTRSEYCRETLRGLLR